MTLNDFHYVQNCISTFEKKDISFICKDSSKIQTHQKVHQNIITPNNYNFALRIATDI
jgi:hypothetical protein